MVASKCTVLLCEPFGTGQCSMPEAYHAGLAYMVIAFKSFRLD